MAAAPEIPLSSRMERFVKERAFASPRDTVLTIAFAGFSLLLIWLALDWAIFNAVWTKEDADLCHSASGACWSVIDARHRLILFGLYPFDLHWRSTLACIAIIVTVILSCIPLFWGFKRLAALWTIGFLIFYLFMEGSLLGLQQVNTDQWGGLALTLFLFASVVLLGLPMGLGLTLASRSKLPVFRLAATLLIDFVRSLPLVTTLYTAAVVVPLMLPSWLEGDKIWRIILFFALFFACYQAEVFRGGFQAVEKGQFEAGRALGMRPWQVMVRIVLPQVFRHAMPGTVNMVVITFKETALVTIVGLFDVLASANTAYGNGEWAPYYMEVYVFVALIYWVFIFSLGQYGNYLERRLTVTSH